MARTLALALMAALSLGGCAQQTHEVVVIRTTVGEIVFAFYDDVPEHTRNFKELVQSGFYEGTTFHRVIPGFMIQAGDPLSKDAIRENDGSGGPGYTLPAEIKHQHILGAVASARRPDRFNPDRQSNGSQFYICVAPQPGLDGGYTVFGHVVGGLDIATRISTVKRDAKDNPNEEIVIEQITVEHRPAEPSD